MNILIVEDDRLVRNMLYEMVGSFGEHDISVLTNGHNAVSLLADPKHGFDLVFMDLKMPRLDGKSVIVTLQNMVRINFVIITADPSGLPSLPPNSRIIAKPFSAKMISDVIAETEKTMGASLAARKPAKPKLSQAEQDRRDGIGLLSEF